MRRSRDMMLFGANETEHIFRGLALFVYVYVGASIFAAIFTPLSYWIVQWLNEISPNDITTYLLRKRVDIFYDRLRWLPIVLSLPFLLKTCGLFSFKNLGIAFDKHSLKIFGKYCIFGVCCVLLIFLIQYLFLGFRLKPDVNFVRVILNAFAGSLLLAILEEIVFRGLLMRCIYTAFGPISAILLSSLFFAYKHFKAPTSIWDATAEGGKCAEWFSGFSVMYYDSIGIAYNFSLIVFSSLVALGIILSIFYIKTKSLNSAIGFHFGTVFCMLICKKSFEHVSDKYQLFLGSEWITDGILGLSALCAIMLFAIFFIRDAKNNPNGL